MSDEAGFEEAAAEEAFGGGTAEDVGETDPENPEVSEEETDDTT